MRIRVRNIVLYALFCTCAPFIINAQLNKSKPTIKITFINTINQQPLVLATEQYTNCHNETFSISKLKYYISNISLQNIGKNNTSERNSYHLINEEDSLSKSFSFFIRPDQYEAISFLIGVDSIKKVSGAQTDALDPLNGMFWTWNTGYIMFKMEGTSPQSKKINNKIEYHIGGFGGINNVLRTIKLNLVKAPIIITEQTLTEILIQVDVDKIWNNPNRLTITQTPVCTTPGTLAASIADNYATAFKISKVISY